MPAEEPSPDELAAMAYADGELRGGALDAFEARLVREPGLRLAVSRYQELEVLARQIVSEPADYEWAELERHPVHRSLNVIGWVLLLVGAAGLGVIAIVELCVAPGLTLPLRLLLVATLVGLVLLFLATVWARMRLLPHDRYTRVER